MPAFITKTAKAYKVEIFIGGDHAKALDFCEEFCTAIGLCVTVEPTTFTYKGGRCDGVRVGLINYARFDKLREEIWATAVQLAHFLLDNLGQGSYTVQDDETSFFYSRRPEDGCHSS